MLKCFVKYEEILLVKCLIVLWVWNKYSSSSSLGLFFCLRSVIKAPIIYNALALIVNWKPVYSYILNKFQNLSLPSTQTPQVAAIRRCTAHFQTETAAIPFPAPHFIPSMHWSCFALNDSPLQYCVESAPHVVSPLAEGKWMFLWVFKHSSCPQCWHMEQALTCPGSQCHVESDNNAELLSLLTSSCQGVKCH